MIANFCLPSAV
uniref:Uncharacterized protein n=1 Tax=Arundo donax TaxID=35708 RepID=A0A0A8YUM0_ARUDO